MGICKDSKKIISFPSLDVEVCKDKDDKIPYKEKTTDSLLNLLPKPNEGIVEKCEIKINPVIKEKVELHKKEKELNTLSMLDEYSSSEESDKNEKTIISKFSLNNSEKESFDFFGFKSKVPNIEEIKPITQKMVSKESYEPYQLKTTNIQIDGISCKKIAGRDGKKLLPNQIIEINASDLRRTQLEDLISMSEEKSLNYSEHIMDRRFKDKNQITYLALEAKRNESAYKNDWAKTKQDRRNSRMRYGF